MSQKKKTNESKKKFSHPMVPLVQKDVSLTPKKRPAEEDLPSTSSSSGQLIAYVHEVSPTKTNRTNTVEYFDVLLQTEKSQTQRAVCFTKSKRQLFVDRQKTKTPVKLTNYSMSTNDADILINNMTRVSQAQDGEYSFQFSPPQKHQPVFISLTDIIETGKPFDIVSVRGKITKKGNTKVVGKGKLNVAETTLSDGTSSIKLDLWQDHISMVQAGGVYSFTGLRIREWNQNLNLSTTQQSNITIVSEEEHPVLSSIPIETNDTAPAESVTPVKVSCITSIENIERFLQCANPNCRKKIKQDSGKSVVKCDLCGHTMKQSRCKKNIFVTVMMEVTGKREPLRFIFFKDMLLKVLPTFDHESIVSSEVNDQICEVLLSLENFSIAHNDNVVTAIELH